MGRAPAARPGSTRSRRARALQASAPPAAPYPLQAEIAALHCGAADALGADRGPLRRAGGADRIAGRRAQPRGRDRRVAEARPPGWPRPRGSTSTATTTCTPPAPSCCGGWAATRRRAGPTSARWSWCARRPSGASWSGAWRSSADGAWRAPRGSISSGENFVGGGERAQVLADAGHAEQPLHLLGAGCDRELLAAPPALLAGREDDAQARSSPGTSGPGGRARRSWSPPARAPRSRSAAAGRWPCPVRRSARGPRGRLSCRSSIRSCSGAPMRPDSNRTWVSGI